MVAQAWLEQNYRDCESFSVVQAAVRRDDLQWTPITLNLQPPVVNETAYPEPVSYSAVPAWIADLLVRRGAQVAVGGARRELLRVPCSEGAELITWPPVYHSDNGRNWAFSYKITITLQTLARCPDPRIHFHYGIRRWASQPLLEEARLRLGKHARSVYLRPAHGWMGLPPTGAFALARLRRAYASDTPLPVWESKVTDIAKRLRVPFPDAEQLARNPAGWLAGDREGVIAAVVDDSRGIHPVAPGVDLPDHEQITTTIAACLEDELELHQPLRKLRLQKTSAHPLTNDLREMTSEQRLSGLEESVGGTPTVEVYWQQPEVRDMLVDRLVALLRRPRPGLVEPDEVEGATGHRRRRKRKPEPEPEPAAHPREIPLPSGGRLRIIPRPIGELGALFPLPDTEIHSARDRGNYRRKQMEGRAASIQRELPGPAGPTLALIELPNYQEPEMRRQFGWRDPKGAIRLGMARTGRVTQFVTSGQEDRLKRCESAVRDGLRHLGYLPCPIGIQFTNGKELPSDLIIAAVWHVRLTLRRGYTRVYMPVVVLMHSEHPQVRAWIPDGRGARPYHQALCDITTMDPRTVSRQSRPQMLDRLRQFLEQDLWHLGSSDVVVLAVAQNIRELWNGLENPQIEWDALRFERHGHAQPLRDLRGRLRVIRLRTNERNETPEWFTTGSLPGKGFTQGVFIDGAPRLFYNSGAKPHTMAGGKRGKQVNPREHTAIPSLLEVLPVAIQPGEEPGVWACAIDQWRRMGNLLTNDMLLLPLPFPFARKMEEYARVIGPWVFPEEWDLEEDEGPDEVDD